MAKLQADLIALKGVVSDHEIAIIDMEHDVQSKHPADPPVVFGGREVSLQSGDEEKE